MDRWHNMYEDGCAFFCTVTVSEWRPLMNQAARKILYDTWEQCRTNNNVSILGYCIMPNHVHFMLWSELGANVRQFLHTMTALTSKKLQPGGGFWKERPRAVPIISRQVFLTKLDYMHRNPVRAGLVVDPADWLDSSYRQIVLGQDCSALRCDDLSVLPLR